MNKIEFKEVLNVMGIKDKKNLADVSAEVYEFCGLDICFSGTFYTKVLGKVPLDLANYIFDTYPNRYYHIRVAGGAESFIPNDWAQDAQLEEDNDLEAFKMRTDTDKYVKTYHIDTKEGLLIFLLEVKDYYLRKSSEEAVEVQKYDELLNIVNDSLLEKAKLDITREIWMRGCKKCFPQYMLTLERNSNPLVSKLLTKLDEFDNIVNPFTRDDIDLDIAAELFKSRMMSIKPFIEKDGVKRDNCLEMSISLDGGKSTVCYYRNPEGFSYQVHSFPSNLDDNTFTFIHYYSDILDEDYSIGNVIFFSDKKDGFVRSIRYSLTTNKFKIGALPEMDATPDILAFLYSSLLEAIELGKTITVDNMCKKDNQKKLK